VLADLFEEINKRLENKDHFQWGKTLDAENKPHEVSLFRYVAAIILELDSRLYSENKDGIIQWAMVWPK
jgi:hypothetical protein